MIDVSRLRREMRAGRLSRRDFMGILAAAGVVVTTVRAARAAQTPTVYTWSGYDDAALYPSYVKKYGAAPDFAIWGDEEEGLHEDLRGGFKPDVVFPCAYKIAKWYEAGVINEIDTAKLSN